jgi:N-methylhydantoinase A/oxoprolinase/acetone carboxylase beta subunit
LYPGRFACRQAKRSDLQAHTRAERQIWDSLASGPRTLADLVRAPAMMRSLKSMVRNGSVALCGMTPSDAMHVLEVQRDWNAEAAGLGASLLLREGRNWRLQVNDADIVTLCSEIREHVVRKTGRLLCEAAFAHDPGIRFAAHAGCGPFGDKLINNVAAGTPFSQLMNMTVGLNVPLVAIGAPVGSYYPLVARRLNAELLITEHAAVTNAIGAVAGVIMQSVDIVVTQTTLSVFRVHGPNGPQDFDDAETAIARAHEVSRQLAYQAAARAGARMPEVETTVRKKSATQASGEEFMAEAIVCSTATGRPAVGDSPIATA